MAKQLGVSRASLRE
ncbi:hypothetical protein, partial [Salmonella enterica]